MALKDKCTRWRPQQQDSHASHLFINHCLISIKCLQSCMSVRVRRLFHHPLQFTKALRLQTHMSKVKESEEISLLSFLLRTANTFKSRKQHADKTHNTYFDYLPWMQNEIHFFLRELSQTGKAIACEILHKGTHKSAPCRT